MLDHMTFRVTDMKRAKAFYSAALQGKAAALPPLQVQYSDYARWQRNWLQGDVLAEQIAYWQQTLAELPVVHSVPLDYPRPREQTFAGATLQSTLDSKRTQQLKQLCQAQGATLFMGLHAAFSTLLARYSNEHDIVLGSPIANREQAEVAPLIGFFVNTLDLSVSHIVSSSFASQDGTASNVTWCCQVISYKSLVL